MHTFGAVIDSFGGPTKFGAATAIDASHARVMKFRDSIPADYWPDIVRAASRLKISGINYEVLASIAARKRRQRLRGAA